MSARTEVTVSCNSCHDIQDRTNPGGWKRFGIIRRNPYTGDSEGQEVRVDLCPICTHNLRPMLGVILPATVDELVAERFGETHQFKPDWGLSGTWVPKAGSGLTVSITHEEARKLVINEKDTKP